MAKVFPFAALLTAIVNCATVQPPPPPKPPAACIDQFENIGSVDDLTARALGRSCEKWAGYFPGMDEADVVEILSTVRIKVYPMHDTFQCGFVENAIGCIAPDVTTKPKKTYHMFISQNRRDQEKILTAYHEVGHVLLYQLGVYRGRHHDIIDEAEKEF